MKSGQWNKKINKTSEQEQKHKEANHCKAQNSSAEVVGGEQNETFYL